MGRARRREDKPWVLVADGVGAADDQARTTLWAVRCLGAAGYPTAVATASRLSAAGASKYCRRRVIVPPAEDDRFAPAIREELIRGGYLTVIPAGDLALLALGAPVSHLVDKSRLVGSVEAVGLATPPTEVFETADALVEAAPALSFPIIVKPAFGKPTWCLTGPRELEPLRGRPGRLLVQPYVREELWSVAGVLWRGNLVAAVHQRFLRTWPPAAGMACAAETIEPDLDIEGRIVDLLREHDGVFQVDLAGRYVLDVNPRVYASMALASAAGVNLVGMFCDLLRGRDVSMVRARPGVFFRWLEGDVRYVVDRLRKGQFTVSDAIRSLRPRRHAAHGGPESLSDPGPMFARARFIARELSDRASHRRRGPVSGPTPARGAGGRGDFDRGSAS